MPVFPGRKTPSLGWSRPSRAVVVVRHRSTSSKSYSRHRPSPVVHLRRYPGRPAGRDSSEDEPAGAHAGSRRTRRQTGGERRTIRIDGIVESRHVRRCRCPRSVCLLSAADAPRPRETRDSSGDRRRRRDEGARSPAAVTGGRARGLPVGEVVSFDDVDCRAGDTGAATMTERSYGRSVGRLAGHSPVSHMVSDDARRVYAPQSQCLRWKTPSPTDVTDIA